MKDLSKVTIETERLRLVPVSPKYRERIFENFTDDIAKFLTTSPTGNIFDTDIFIAESIKNMSEGKELVLTITKKTSGKFIGMVGLHKIDLIPCFGIWIKKDAHGYKFGQEAVAGLKKWADKNLPNEYVIYGVAEANIASRKIAESLGGILTETDKTITNKKHSHPSVEYKIYLRR